MKLGYDLYELSCGHSQEIRKQHYKTGKYRCKTCKQQKHTLEAEAVGLTLVEDLGSYKRYKLPCNHLKDILPEQVRTGSYACDLCNQSKQEILARGLNLEIISKVASKLQIRFLSCGHTQTVKSSSLSQQKKPVCKACIYQSHMNYAEREGLLIVEQTNLTTTREFVYQLPCGCQKKLKAGNVKRGVWACDVHSNWWTKGSGIYVLKLIFDSESIVKIGVACNVTSRVSSYGLVDGAKFELVKYYSFDNFKHATDAEKEFHRDNAHLKIPIALAKAYLLRSGYTECYFIEHLDTLIEKLEYNISENK